MAGHPKPQVTHDKSKTKCGRNFLKPKIREEKKGKEKRNVLTPISNPIPVHSCVENRIGPKSALRLVCPHTPLVVRPVRKALG